MLSAAKHLALLFVGGKVQSEILRCAQNDSLADGCTDVTLSSATDQVNAKDSRSGFLKSSVRGRLKKQG
jgi:hypothetical protein